MSARVRFALVGSGMVAPTHARAIQAAKGAALALVVSRDPARGRAFAAEFGVPWSDDLEGVLARREADALDITAPPAAHRALALRAAAAGVPVLLEKPIAPTVEDAEAITAAFRRRGVPLGVIFQGRFKKTARAAKALVERGRLGRILFAEASVKWFRPKEYYDAIPWRKGPAGAGGGVLLNQASHAMDLLLWLAGDVARVTAATANLLHDVAEEDTTVALLRFRSGALGAVRASTALWPGTPDAVEIHGENGALALEAGRVKAWRVRDATPSDAPPDESGEEGGGQGADPMAFPITGHVRQIEDFVAALRDRRDPAVTGEEATRVIRLIEAVRRSAAEGREVEVG